MAHALTVPRLRVTPALLAGVLLGGTVACHLDELVSSAPSPLRALALAPTDTLLTQEGQSFCFRWTLSDARGASVTNREPVFDLLTTADSQLVEVGRTDGCVTAVRVRGTESIATVRATADTLTATATVHLDPRVTP